jgi:hypothetical protein
MTRALGAPPKLGDREVVTDPTRTIEERVAAGARLWDSINTANAALEVLKGDLRKLAVSKGKGEAGTITFEGAGMTRAIVTTPLPNLYLKKGKNPAPLAAKLGANFGRIFRESKTWVVRENAGAIFARLPRKLQEALLDVLGEDSGKPRVTFQYGGAGLSDISVERGR